MFLPFPCRDPPLPLQRFLYLSVVGELSLLSSDSEPVVKSSPKLFTSQMTGRDLLKDRSLKPGEDRRE